VKFKAKKKKQPYVPLLNLAITAKTLFLEILFAWHTAIGVASTYEIPVFFACPNSHCNNNAKCHKTRDFQVTNRSYEGSAENSDLYNNLR
jgi:hypothetical protein